MSGLPQSCGLSTKSSVLGCCDLGFSFALALTLSLTFAFALVLVYCRGRRGTGRWGLAAGPSSAPFFGGDAEFVYFWQCDETSEAPSGRAQGGSCVFQCFRFCVERCAPVPEMPVLQPPV